MELSKLLDGFIDDGILTIKAQVQVIRERADRPFRCLDCHYRRELVRVYLTNVEQIFRRFVEERRSRLGKLLEDTTRWFSLCGYWLGMDQSSRRRISREKIESVLKVIVKHFFIEKEVTSTLVMDSLHSGLKALEGQNKGKKSKGNGNSLEVEEPAPLICIDKETFILVDDVLFLLERAAMEPLPPKDDKGPQNRTKDGTAGEELNKDSIECDERRLTELGRRTIEIFVLSFIFSSKIEVLYQEAVAWKKQEELIREEEEAWLAEIEQKSRRRTAEKEKKSKKKQGKQKRNNRKAKNKGMDERSAGVVLSKDEQHNPTIERKDTSYPEILFGKSDVVEDVPGVSDSVDCVPETLPVDSEGRDASSVHWDPDTSEMHPHTEARSKKANEISVVQNGINGRSSSTVDDSSSTCSSDSSPSVAMTQNGNFCHHKNKKSPSSWRDHQAKSISDTAAWVYEDTSVPSEFVADASQANSAPRSSSTNGSQSHTVPPLQDKEVNGIERQVKKKEQETGIFLSKVAVDDKTNRDRDACKTSPPKSTAKSITAVAPLKSDLKSAYGSDGFMHKKSPLNDLGQPDRLLHSANSAESCTVSKSDPPKFTTPKLAEKPMGYQIHVRNEKLQAQGVPDATDKAMVPPIPELARPLSAPLVPGPRPAVSFVSVIQTAPLLSRSVSATGRLGHEPSASATPSYVPLSYRNAMMGGSSSAYYLNHSASSPHSYSHAPSLVSVPMFSPHNSDTMESSPIKPSLPFGMVNHNDVLQNGSLGIEKVCQNLPVDLCNPLQNRSRDHSPSEYSASTSESQGHILPDEFPHLDIINELLEDEHGIGMVSRANSGYQSFSNEPRMDRHYSLPNEPSSMPNGFGLSASSCRFDRARSYHDNLLRRGNVTSVNICDNTIGVVIPRFSSQPCLDARVDGLVPNQWQMPGTDVPFLGFRNKENDTYPYHVQEYPNPNVGISGYTVFRPSSNRL